MIRSRIFAFRYSGCCIEDESERLDHFLDGLVKFRFARIFGLNLVPSKRRHRISWSACENRRSASERHWFQSNRAGAESVGARFITPNRSKYLS